MPGLQLESARLLIRPFVQADLGVIHHILEEAFGWDEEVAQEDRLAERRSWLEWAIHNEEWLAHLHQPPFGDRAVVLRENKELIGAVGYVPLLDRFGQIPELALTPGGSSYATAEIGLFWATGRQHQGRGYATEAARTLVKYGFDQLHLARILAVTEYQNRASQRVMEKVGMTITRNPYEMPAHLQIVGVLNNPKR